MEIKTFVKRIEISYEEMQDSSAYKIIMKRAYIKFKFEILDLVFKLTNELKIPIVLLPYDMKQDHSYEKMATVFELVIEIVIPDYNTNDVNIHRIAELNLNTVIKNIIRAGRYKYITVDEKIKDINDKKQMKKFKSNIKLKNINNVKVNLKKEDKKDYKDIFEGE